MQKNLNHSAAYIVQFYLCQESLFSHLQLQCHCTYSTVVEGVVQYTVKWLYTVNYCRYCMSMDWFNIYSANKLIKIITFVVPYLVGLIMPPNIE